MREMNEFQYTLVKLFLDAFKVSPRSLASRWKIPQHEVYRVQLTVNYDVYKNDQIAEEDVMLAMEGV